MSSPTTSCRLSDRSSSGERNALRKTLVRVCRMRYGHRVDEVLLEARLDGGLDFLDRADDGLDLLACRAVEEGDARAGACGVSGGRDAGRVAVRHQSENERMHGVDVGAERARKPHAVDAVEPVAVEQQLAARVESRLREL